MAYVAETAFLAKPETRGFLADLLARYTAWASYRKTYAELSRLTDRELADIGLHRAEIADIAHGKR